MASPKKNLNKTISQTKETVNKTVNKVISQAKDSMKMLESLEKETLAKVQSFVKIPNADERKKLTNDTILASLKKLGVATQVEVEDLSSKIRSLESEISKLRAPKQ